MCLIEKALGITALLVVGMHNQNVMLQEIACTACAETARCQN